MSPKHYSKRETTGQNKAKLARLDPVVANALEATAKLSGVSENAILNYAVSNALANVNTSDASSLRSFTSSVISDTPMYVATVRDHYSETIDLLSGKEET